MDTDSPSSLESTPALWNPNAAACWCLVFTPVFGMFLHARNAESLGRLAEAKANRIWLYVAITFLAVTLFTIFIPRFPPGIVRLCGLGILLGWYFSVAKKQVQYVKETWQDQYPRKTWGKPILIAIGGLVAYFVIAIILGVINAVVFGRITSGN